MNKSKSTLISFYFSLLSNLILFIFTVTACAPSTLTPNSDLNAVYTQAFETALAALQPTGTPISTEH